MNVTVLNWYHRQSGAVASIATLTKGASIEYPVAASIKIFEAWGLGDITFRTDGEPAIKAFQTALTTTRQRKTLAENSPRYSSQSLGPGENCNKLVEGQARVLLFHLEARVPKLVLTINIVAWAVRHAYWLWTRCQVKNDGKTAYKNLKG